MRIDYPSRSKFLGDCEEAIANNRDALLQRIPISITFSSGGYNGEIRVTIEKKDHISFQTDWVSSYPSRFPARIKATAFALFRKGCFGDYLIAHYSGTITIRYLKPSPIITKQSVDKSIKLAELPEIKTAKTTIKQKQIHSPLAKEHLVEILKRIPWKTWEKIVGREPEWDCMEPFFGKFNYGSFAVLMLVTGLNDYQLKGKAEIAYWPKIHNLLKNSKTPSSPKDLHELLKPFYNNERLRNAKLQRLKRFLKSSLVHDLWDISSREVSKKFRHIWDSLAKTMEQNPRAKTICFAMKCLGLTLLMVKEYQFDFSTIPIPVDSRVMRFTKRTGISASKNPQHLREIWSEVLSLMRSSIPEITMIHLDSLIWQIASLNDDELESYFGSIGIVDVGRDLLTFLHNGSSALKKSARLQMKKSNKVIKSGRSKEKNSLILFPCSAGKNDEVYREIFEEREEKRAIDYIKTTKYLLTSGREGMSSSIDPNSLVLSALDRYDGHLYNSSQGFRNTIKEAYSKNNIHILILSAVYGILTPSERIHNYNKKMDAMYWRRHGLPKIIEEYIEQNNITHVYGLFSRTTDYIKIMKSVDWKQLNVRSNLQLSRTYYISFQGSGSPYKDVPQTLGKLLISFINSGFNHEHFYENPFHGQLVDFISHI